MEASSVDGEYDFVCEKASFSVQGLQLVYGLDTFKHSIYVLGILMGFCAHFKARYFGLGPFWDTEISVFDHLKDVYLKLCAIPV